MSVPGRQRILSPLRVLSFLGGVILLVLLLRQIEFGELGRLLFNAKAEWLLLGGAAYLVKSMVRASRTAALLRELRPRFLAMLRLSLASSLATQLLPFKLGELVYIYLLRRELKSPVAEGVSSLMIMRVFDLLAIALLFIGAALVFGLPASFSVYLAYIIAFVALLLALLAAAALALRFMPALAGRLHWESHRARLLGWLERRSPRVQALAVKISGWLVGSLRRLAGSLRSYQGRQIAGWFALALLEWLINLVVYHALLLGIGLSPHPFDTAAAVTFAALASVLPINSLGSFGTLEAGWATGLILLGYDPSTAIASGFATHLLQVGYMLLMGGAAWVTYLVGPKKTLPAFQPILNTFRSYPPALRRAWLLACALAGLLLTLAIPITPPGGFVEQTQRILLNLNFAELLGRGALSLLVTLLIGLAVGALLLAVSVLLAGWQPRPAQPPSRWEWLRYALPMLVLWSFYLLAFWPAMMSSDSTHAWRQAMSGHFDNGNPLLYLLVVSLFQRLFGSPAPLAAAQMIGLSLLVAWGLGMLREHGLPTRAAWLAALLFALSPANGALSVTIWKDIPYSMAVLALSLLILRLILRPGEVTRRGLWVGLGLLAVPVGLLRYNGLVIAPLVFLILALIYRTRWRVFARALLLFVAVWWLVKTPLSAALKVEDTSPVAGTLAMHHIAAHIHYDTPIAPADRESLERIMPLEEWHYYCYLVNPVLFNTEMDLAAMMDSLGELNFIALRLFAENPTVDINQTFCASSLVYRVLPPYDGYFYAAALTPDGKGGATYIYPNVPGLEEAPVLPGLSRALIRLLEDTRNGNLSWLIWRPALYLYLFIFLGAVYALRARSWKPALFLLPGVVHSAVLFAVNISQAFRYQYPVYLLALFSIALIFLPGEEPHPGPRAGMEI